MEEGLKKLKQQFGLGEVDIRTYSPQVLAYIGDAVYELIVRTILVCHGNCQANRLHKRASSFARASAQSLMIYSLEANLTAEEMQIYKRGRNTKTANIAKNATVSDYRHATGFEALVGYLYLTGQTERLMELIKLGMEKTGGTP